MCVVCVWHIIRTFVWITVHESSCLSSPVDDGCALMRRHWCWRWGQNEACVIGLNLPRMCPWCWILWLTMRWVLQAVEWSEGGGWMIKPWTWMAFHVLLLICSLLVDIHISCVKKPSRIIVIWPEQQQRIDCRESTGTKSIPWLWSRAICHYFAGITGLRLSSSSSASWTCVVPVSLGDTKARSSCHLDLRCW